MAELAVTAIGADRPGIIARVTGVLLEHGGNLEDSSMTVLGGHFAIMLLVRTEVDPVALEAALSEATRDLGLIVTVREIGPGHRTDPPTHMLTVYGIDRPGLVHAVTKVLAEAEVNVTDLTTRVLEGERPVYAMMLEVALPTGVRPEQLVEDVRERVEGVEVSIQPLDLATF